MIERFAISHEESENVYLFQVVKGTAGLVGDALTFKWAQASMAQVAVNTVVVVEVK